MSAGIELAPLVTKIKVDTVSFKNDMQKAASLGVAEADKISKSMSGIAKTGDKLMSVGSALTKGITLPATVASVGITKMALDFETSFAKVSTLLDDNRVDFQAYKKDLLDASSDTKVAVDDFNESVYQSISAGVAQEKAIKFTSDAMKLAKGGFTEGASAVDLLTTCLNAYDLEAEKANKVSDMLITTQNLGKTTVNELASSMGKVIPTAKSYNVNLENVNTTLAVLTKNGIATAEATTYYNSMLNELGKSGTKASDILKSNLGKSFAELQAEGIPLTEILGALKTEAENSGMSLGDMFGSAEAAKAALTIMKDDGEEYNDILGQMERSAGATQKAFEKIDASPAEQLKGALNELKNQAIELGGEFVPIVDKITDVLGDLTESFSALSDEEKENVLKWVGVAAAAGPALSILGGGIKVTTGLSSAIGGASKALSVLGTSSAVTATSVGGTVTSVGSVTTALAGMSAVVGPLVLGVGALGLGVYAFHESNQLMKRGLDESSEEMSLMEKTMAKLQGQEIHTREELEKLGWIHKEFAEGISPEFQKEVEKSTEEVQKFGIHINEIGFDGVFTEEEAKGVTDRVASLCNSAIETITSRKGEIQQAYSEALVANDGILDDSEQRFIEIMSKGFDENVIQIEKAETRIKEINQLALDEGRTLREEEIEEIEHHYSTIARLKLEASATSKEEIIYAEEEFNARLKVLTIEGAEELMVEQAEIRDKTIVDTAAHYNTLIELAKQEAATLYGEDKELAERQIAELEKQRDKELDIAQSSFDDRLALIEEKYPELIDTINKYTGEELTKGDIHAQKQLEQAHKKYEGLSKIAEDGNYSILNNSTGTYSNLVIDIDEKTKEVISIYDVTTGEVAAYSEKMAKDVSNMSEKEVAAFQKIMTSGAYYINSMGEMVDANGNVISSFGDVTTEIDGTRTGIVNINGTPFNITVNKDGTITALNEINAAADNAARNRSFTITTNYTSSGQQYEVGPGGIYYYHFNGLENVPYDGYQARLHKDERVLTAEENKAYTSGMNNPVDYNTIAEIVKNTVSGLVMEVDGRQFGRVIDGITTGRR